MNRVSGARGEGREGDDAQGQDDARIVADEEAAGDSGEEEEEEDGEQESEANNEVGNVDWEGEVMEEENAAHEGSDCEGPHLSIPSLAVAVAVAVPLFITPLHNHVR